MPIGNRQVQSGKRRAPAVLCIDDNPEGLAIRKVFLEHFGYEVLGATSGREGLELLASNPVDAIILDYRMPEMDGGEVARRARAIKPGVPILLLSGYPSAVPAEALESCDAFILKGRPPAELLQELERVLGAPQRSDRRRGAKIARTWERAVSQAEDRSRQMRQRQQEQAERERLHSEEALHSTEKLALAGRLSASIAHEINNPLESVLGLLHLMQSEATFTPRGHHYLEMAREELQRVAAIARQALSLHRDTPDPVAVRVPELLKGVLELYQPKLKSKNIHVVTRFDPMDICAFPGELRQVFSNLILNAAEATRPGGRLTLRVSAWRNGRDADGRWARITVADDGSGIPAENRRRLFTPFFTTKGAQGTGLGLWLSARIVHKHGGHIRMRSCTERGRSGTVFQVLLPGYLPAAAKPSRTDQAGTKAA